MLHQRRVTRLDNWCRWAAWLALTAVTGSAAGCSRESAPPLAKPVVASSPESKAAPAADRPPAALVQIGDSAAELFDAAYASDWNAAGESVQSLHEAAAALNTSSLPKPDVVAQLQSRLGDVANSVSERQRLEAMDASNGITHLVADLAAQFQTPVPFEAVMLAYYGRQLELGIAGNQPTTLTRASADLRSAWNRLEPAVQRRGHPDEARQFTDIVVTLEGAKRPADFVRPTRAERVAADRIAQFFR